MYNKLLIMTYKAYLATDNVDFQYDWWRHLVMINLRMLQPHRRVNVITMNHTTLLSIRYRFWRRDTYTNFTII